MIYRRKNSKISIISDSFFVFKIIVFSFHNEIFVIFAAVK